MKKVIVHPERCVGCMQCMIACATAHSRSGELFSAICEFPLPKSRVHVGAGLYGEGFPNRCRHCDPAPCMFACLPGAIYRNADFDTVMIDPDKCINCASCAMACPFGVIRYHEDIHAPRKKVVAVKCDNCISRQAKGLVPACVEVCKSNALRFETSLDAFKRKNNEVAGSVSSEARPTSAAPGFNLLNAIKKSQVELITH
jgi:anaerobic carbon-monoxide dehydrogenase iron sulfur subunit